ncbi:hypothetical protein F5887DRAFT_919561, partial [Amanita rubescens]
MTGPSSISVSSGRSRSAIGQANRNKTSKLRFKRNKKAKAAIELAKRALDLEEKLTLMRAKAPSRRRRSDRPRGRRTTDAKNRRYLRRSSMRYGAKFNANIEPSIILARFGKNKKKTALDFESAFTTVAVMEGSSDRVHVDANDHGISWILPLGDWEGGRLVIPQLKMEVEVHAGQLPGYFLRPYLLMPACAAQQGEYTLCAAYYTAGAYYQTAGGICVDMSNMDKILEIHAEYSDLVCQLGARWLDVNVTVTENDVKLNNGSTGIPIFFSYYNTYNSLYLNLRLTPHPASEECSAPDLRA